MGKRTIPSFELKSVFEDGSETSPVVVPVADIPWDAATGRRGFLCAGISLCGMMAVARAESQEETNSIQNQAIAGDRESGFSPDWIRAHRVEVLDVAFSPDNRFIASTSADGTCKIWDASSRSLLKSLEGSCGEHGRLAISPAGDLLVVEGGGGSVGVWGLPEGDNIMSVRLDREEITALSFGPNGSTIAFLTGKSMVKRWSPYDREPPVTPFFGERFASNICFVPNGERILSVTAEGRVTVWAEAGETFLNSFDCGPCVPESLAVFPDGTKLALANEAREIVIWEISSGSPVGRIGGSADPICAVAVAPNQSVVACAGSEVKIGRLPDSTLHKSLETSFGHDAKCLSISSDGKCLSVGYSGGVILLWDLATAELVSYLYDPSVNEPGVDGMMYTAPNRDSGEMQTSTFPCGAPLPTDAVCSCNCVPGTYTPSSRQPIRMKLTCPSNYVPGRYGPRVRLQRGTRKPPPPGMVCTCNRVLTCSCEAVCQAHRLLHRDAIVRASAFYLLLAMGRSQFEYMRWAADKAPSQIRWRVYDVMRNIEREEQAVVPWPDWTLEDCLKLLVDADEVIATMGAQLLALSGYVGMTDVPEHRVRFLLEMATKRPWYVRYP